MKFSNEPTKKDNKEDGQVNILKIIIIKFINNIAYRCIFYDI